jgi:hypothetical protein
VHATAPRGPAHVPVVPCRGRVDHDMTDQLIDFFILYGLGGLLLLLLAAAIVLGVTAAGVVAFCYRLITKPKPEGQE